MSLLQYHGMTATGMHLVADASARVWWKNPCVTTEIVRSISKPVAGFEQADDPM